MPWRRGSAHVTGKHEKHGVKQTERMLSDKGIDIWLLFRPWAKFVVREVRERKENVVALERTRTHVARVARAASYPGADGALGCAGAGRR